jgi:hypothetical protein
MINELDLAKDPTTSLDILERLAKSDRIAVVKAIAANPSTPVSLLIELAEHEYMSVRKEIALNLNTPIEILPKFINDRKFVINALPENPHLQADLQAAKSTDTDLDQLAELAQSPYVFIRREIALNPNTTADLLEKLSEDEDWQILHKVAKHPNTPLAILEMLAKGDVYGIMDDLSKNPQLQPDIQAAKSLDTKVARLIELSHSPYSFVRQEIAANPHTPTEILVRFAKSKNYDGIVSEVAKNPNTPMKTLSKIAVNWLDHTYDDIFNSLMSNPRLKSALQTAKNSINPDQLVKLAQHTNPIIRREVSKNKSTPLKIIIKLADDPKFFVRREVAYHPEIPPSILINLLEDPENNYYDLVVDIAGKPTTPAIVLRKLMDNQKNWSELYRNCATWHYLEPVIVRNPNTPLDILEGFVAEVEVSNVEGSDQLSAFSLSLARGIAENPNTSESLLIKILDITERCADERARIAVVEAIAEHPNTSESLLIKILDII